MSGLIVFVNFAPSEGDMLALWKKATECLAEKFAFDEDFERCLVGIKYCPKEDDWATEDAYDKDVASIEEFVLTSQGVALDTGLWLNGFEASCRISLFLAPSAKNRPCLAVEFGSLFFSNLYPAIGEEADPDVKKALVSFCLQLGKAIGTKAFVVDVDRRGLLRHIDPSSLAASLLDYPKKSEALSKTSEYNEEIDSQLLSGRLFGISRDIVSREALIAAWGTQLPILQSTTGYVIFALF